MFKPVSAIQFLSLSPFQDTQQLNAFATAAAASVAKTHFPQILDILGSASYSTAAEAAAARTAASHSWKSSLSSSFFLFLASLCLVLLALRLNAGILTQPQIKRKTRLAHAILESAFPMKNVNSCHFVADTHHYMVNSCWERVNSSFRTINSCNKIVNSSFITINSCKKMVNYRCETINSCNKPGIHKQ